MKKKIAILLLLLFYISALSACKSPEIVFEQDNIGEEVENTNALDKKLESMAEVEVKGKYDKNSETVTCVVTSVDLYTYVMDNMDELAALESEQLYDHLIQYASEEDSPKISTELEVPVEYYEEKLYADTSSFEYQDAIHGGLNSALTEMFILSIEAMEEAIGE